jgi:hypothetical protein
VGFAAVSDTLHAASSFRRCMGGVFCPRKWRAHDHGVVLAFVGMPMTSVLASLVRPKKIGSSEA